jgi:hypothetical protein
VNPERGPRFAPAESEDPTRRIRRLEDWAGRHDQWSAQTAVEGHEKVAHVEERVTVLEAKLTRLYAAVGEHRLKWGIVAWVLGTAAAAGIAMLAR